MAVKGIKVMVGKGKKYQILAGKGPMSARLVGVAYGLVKAKETAKKYHEKHPGVYVGVMEMRRLRIYKPTKK